MPPKSVKSFVTGMSSSFLSRSSFPCSLVYNYAEADFDSEDDSAFLMLRRRSRADASKKMDSGDVLDKSLPTGPEGKHRVLLNLHSYVFRLVFKNIEELCC